MFYALSNVNLTTFKFPTDRTALFMSKGLFKNLYATSTYYNTPLACLLVQIQFPAARYWFSAVSKKCIHIRPVTRRTCASWKNISRYLEIIFVNIAHIIYKETKNLDIFLRDFHESFLYKDYAFCGFLLCPDSFLECQRFVNLAVHFIKVSIRLFLAKRIIFI